MAGRIRRSGCVDRTRRRGQGRGRRQPAAGAELAADGAQADHGEDGCAARRAPQRSGLGRGRPRKARRTVYEIRLSDLVARGSKRRKQAGYSTAESGNNAGDTPHRCSYNQAPLRNDPRRSRPHHLAGQAHQRQADLRRHRNHQPRPDAGAAGGDVVFDHPGRSGLPAAGASLCRRAGAVAARRNPRPA